MPVRHNHWLLKRTKDPQFWLIYILSIIFTYHISVVVYSASSYMEQYARPEVISALYSIGSALAIICFLFVSRVLQRFGNLRLTLLFVAIETVALIFLGLGVSPELTLVAFVIFLFINPLLYLNIDIFSETLIGNDESATGSKRGLALTLMSIASTAGPLTLSLIVGNDDSHLRYTFFVSAIVLQLFTLLTLIHFRHFKDPEYRELKVFDAIHSFWVEKDMRLSFLANFFLQMFFAWTVILIPLYLATEVGLSWTAIGQILAVGLFAYVIVEYPAGIIADRYIGEKEMMAAGFVIVAVTLSWVSFMSSAPILSWMILMFINRFGAALVETTTESYFFKHTKGTDANVISFFRLSRPLAMIFGSLIGSATLLFLPFDLIFVVLGFLLLPGAFFASRLTDTK